MRSLSLLALGALLAGCGSTPVTVSAVDTGVATPADTGATPDDTGATPPDDTGATPADTGAAVPDDAPPSPTCRGRGGAPGDSVRTLTLGGATRTYRLHVGRAYAPTRPAGLVLSFHGYTSDAAQQELYTGMDALADARGWLVAYPQGTANSWNGGQCCGEATRTGVDDVAFVRALIARVSAEFCVDDARVYATGMSNGGFLSHRLACELADRIAAIAPVAGVLGIPACSPSRAVPVLHFHGTLDALVPYNGGGVLAFTSVADTMRGWATRNGCSGAPAEFLRRGIVRCERWSGCRDDASVELCTVEGGGHTWPGAFPVAALGVTTRDVSASEMMLDFFARHPRR